MTVKAVSIRILVERFVCALVLVPVIFGSLNAQLGSSKRTAQSEGLFPITNETQSLTAQTSTTVLRSNILEKPISPDEYILGPGDVIGVALRGGIDAFFKEAVSPEGNFLIPLAPMLKVSGLSLTDAKKKIHENWASLFPGTSLDVTLLEIRTFRVAVTGAVLFPGIYEASSADRAVTLIDIAGGIYNEQYWRDVYQAEMNVRQISFDDILLEKDLAIGSKRNCALFRKDGTVIDLDLLKFERGSDNITNPFLFEGDRIVISYKSENAPEIEIAGAVQSPGSYEWKENDRVLDLLELGGGLLPNARKDSLLLSSYSEIGEESTVEVSLYDTSSAGIKRLLKQGDLLFVRFMENQPKRVIVTVQGEVRYPGRYPVLEGKTRISDIIRKAGGFTENAFLKGAVVRRYKDPESNLSVELRRIKNRPEQGNLSIEEQFQAFYYRWKGRDRVGVDFERLFEEDDATQDIIVEGGDLITIPDIETNVLVVGMVKNPGLYPYIEGNSFKDYIADAGGYVENARKGMIRLVKLESAVWQKPKKSSVIGPGDMLFVPEAPPRFGWTTFKDIFTVASQAATVLIVILNFTT